MPFDVPFATSEASARGQPAGDAIRLDGIRAGNRVLAVVEHDAARGHIRAHDPNAFEVADGELVGDVDTDGALRVVWATQ